MAWSPRAPREAWTRRIAERIMNLDWITITAVGVPFAGSAIGIALVWRLTEARIRRICYENELKRLMIERGFGPAEIERIIRASATPPAPPA